MLSFHDRHRGPSRQQRCQHAGVVRREVLNKGERHPGIGRKVLEQSCERFETSGGRTDPDDGEKAG